MFRYLLRRMLLLMVNLVAVSVVVFGLGRVLPNVAQPASLTSDATVDDIEPALQHWQAERYGLNRPIHAQYIQWCRSMIIRPMEVLLWTDEQLARPLHRASDADGKQLLIVPDSVDSWRVYEPHSDTDVLQQTLEVDDAEVLMRLSETDLELLHHLSDRGRSPLVQFVAGTVGERINRRELSAVHRAAHQVDHMELTLGWSQTTNRSVWSEFKRRLPISAAIGVLSIALMYGLAIAVGTISAARCGGLFDRWASRCMLLIWSVPIVLTATLLLGWLSGRVQMFPLGGVSSVDTESMSFVTWLVDRLWHLALPVIVLALPGAAYLTRQIRAAVLEQLGLDFIRTARAKGLSHGQVVMHHAMQPAMLVVVTLAATVLPVVIGGSVIVETIFGIDGMGRFVYQAVVSRDYDVVQAFTMLAAAANMFGVLLADGFYCLIDPRVRFAKGAREP